MKNIEQKKRRHISVAALCILFLTMLVQLLVAAGIESQLQSILVKFLPAYFIVSVIAITCACLKGDYFEHNGSMQRGLIAAVLLAILCIGQLAIGGASFVYAIIQYDNNARWQAMQVWQQVQAGDSIDAGTLVEAVYIETSQGVQQLIGGGYGTDNAYQFAIESGSLVVQIASGQVRQMVVRVAVSVFSTTAGTSIFAMEVIWFATKQIDAENKAPANSKNYFALLRLVAFVYFTLAKLGSSFLPARGMRFAAALPYAGLGASLTATAELVFTCIALLLCSRLAETKGWRFALGVGLGLTALGNLLGALAAYYAVYLVSRCVAGFGYGFVWMALRIFAQMQKKPQSALVQLNSGIYAGINFGVALGSLMVAGIGETGVMLAACAACLFAIVGLAPLPNLLAPKFAAQAKGTGWCGFASLLGLCLLALLPTGILTAFTSYYLPLYIPSTGAGVVETGAIQLIYGITIAYFGPAIVKLFAARLGSGTQIIVYLMLLGGALVLFGMLGGVAVAAVAVLIFAIADSFGSIAQNNCFLGNHFIKNRISPARALTLLSLCKKLAESLGPLVFCLATSVAHIAATGVLACCIAALFGVILKWEGKHNANTNLKRLC